MSCIKNMGMVFTLIIMTGSLFAQGSGVNKKVIALANKINDTWHANAPENANIRVAVTEFTAVGDVAQEKKIGLLVSELLTGELARFENFTLIERLQMDKVLEEQALSLTGLIDSKTAVEIGTLLDAQALISGSVLEAGAFFIVNARLVDVTKGNIILSETVEIQQDDLIALSNKLIVTKKYAIDAVYRSFLLPGWGQFYNDTPNRGIFYISASALTLGAALTFKMLGDDNYDTYQKNTQESVKYFAKAKDNYEYRDYALYAFIGCWVLNVADAWFIAQRDIDQNTKQTYPDSGLRMNIVPANDGICLNLTHTF